MRLSPKILATLILALAIAFLGLQPASVESQQNCLASEQYDGTWDGVSLECTGATGVNCKKTEPVCTGGPLQQT